MTFCMFFCVSCVFPVPTCFKAGALSIKQASTMAAQSMQQPYVMFVCIAESTEVTSDIAEELLRAADQYMLDGLKHLCEESISQGLTMDNLTETYDLAENFNAPQLGRRCALFALEHYVVSRPSSSWILPKIEMQYICHVDSCSCFAFVLPDNSFLSHCAVQCIESSLCSFMQELSEGTPQSLWSQLMLRMMPKLKSFLTEELVKINVPTTPCA